MEASVELDCAAAEPANSWYVLNPLRDFVPGRIELVGWRIARRLDGFVACDQRVQLDYFAMALKHVNRELARDEARDRRDARVRRLLFHHIHGCGREYSVFVCFVPSMRQRLKAELLKGWHSAAGNVPYVLTEHPCALVAIWDLLAMHSTAQKFRASCSAWQMMSAED